MLLAGDSDERKRSSRAGPASDPRQDTGAQRSQPDSIAPPQSTGRRWRLALSPAGLILPLVLVAVVLYLLAPDVLPRQRSTGGQALAPAAEPNVSGSGNRSTPLAGFELADNEASLDVDTLLRQASDFVRQGRLDEAIALYESVSRRASKEPRLESGWAKALLMQGRADEAVVHARHAVELEPMNAEAMTVLAQAYLAVGDVGRGLGIGQAAVELDDSSGAAHATLAEAYLADGQPEQAADEAEQALRIDPESAAAHRVRGWLYVIPGQDAQRALEEMRLAVDLEPGEWRYHFDLGRLLLQTGAYAEAVSALERALALQDKGEIYVALAESHLRLDQESEASQYLERARMIGAENTGMDALAAVIQARQGLCQDAERYYDQVLAQDPTSPLALEARLMCEGAMPAPTPEALAVTPTVVATSRTQIQGRIAYPVWNPGTKQYDIYVSHAEGTGRHLLLTGARQPAFSPDGQWLAVNGERHLQENLLILRTDGSGLREVTEHAEDGLPTWSPDGGELAFSSTQHGDRQSRVYVIDPVPLDGRKEAGRVLNAGSYDVSGAYPTWTVDGQVVYGGCDYSVNPAVCGLLKIPAGPGPSTPMALTTNATDTAPAAYNGRVAFMSNREGHWDIYIVDDDGSGLRRLTQSSANEGLPAWAPDGRALAYVSDQGGQWAVWVMAPDGSDQRQLYEIGGGGLAGDWPEERISWAP